jgi:diaminopimelate epimerase
MTSVHVHKVHATGNDFLVVVDLSDQLSGRLDAVALCDRHRGIGADGLIRILAGRDGADLTMDLTNADGSPAEMSGNGVRALASVAVDRGLVSLEFRLSTGGGQRCVAVERDASGAVHWASVDMGPARFGELDLEVCIDDAGHTVRYVGDELDMGNPHFVVFVEEPEAVPVDVHGPLVENHPRFPRRTNVHFARVEDPERMRIVIWERGAGRTLSCGTGACASVAAAHRRGRVGSEVQVAVPGGTLHVSLEEATIVLGGPVQPIFEVDVDPERLRRDVADAGAGASTRPMRPMRSGSGQA